MLKRGCKGLLISVSALLLIYATCAAWPAKATFLLQIIRNIAFTWLLWWCVRNPSTAVGKVLDWAPIVFIGWISYILYIWQAVFVYPEHTEWFCRFPVNILASVGVATLSYFAVERPLNALRGRFSAAARNRKAAAVGTIP
jgi:peptidoglycan/LPS O-acetylase OafA/YrhL